MGDEQLKPINCLTFIDLTETVEKTKKEAGMVVTILKIFYQFNLILSYIISVLQKTR